MFLAVHEAGQRLDRQKAAKLDGPQLKHSANPDEGMKRVRAVVAALK